MSTMNGGGESPRSPPADVSSTTTRPGPHPVLRQSSIDSTMSSSSTTSYSNVLQDPLSPNPGDIANIISLTGSPEAAIHQLLKEKKQSTAQSAQLWRLLNKQRALVLGLNKDLERTLQEKERYRKKVREYQAQGSLSPVNAIKALSIPRAQRSASPAGSESLDELPIQRHSMHVDFPKPAQATPRNSDQTMVSPTASSSSPASFGMQSDSRQTPLPESKVASQSVRDMEPQEEKQLAKALAVHPPVTPTEPSSNSQTSSAAVHMKSSPTMSDLDTASKASFTARRAIGTPRKAHQGPLIEFTASTPQTEDFGMTSPSGRRAPPAPLNLRPKLPVLGPEDHSGSEYEEISDVEEIPAFERGRKKTREDDDKEREIAVLKEQQSRSQSKKEVRSKSATKKSSKPLSPAAPDMPSSTATRSFSPIETPQSGPMQRHLSPPTSLAGVLSRPSSSVDSTGIATQRVVTQFPLSPGLPKSPRPINRPVNSPSPRSPRDRMNAFLVSPPLSPQHLQSPRSSPPMSLSSQDHRQEIPLPPHTPTSLVSPPPSSIAEAEQSFSVFPETSAPLRDEIQKPSTSIGGSSSDSQPPFVPGRVEVGGIYRGLVSEAYPDLLLPPNALPSILINVTSSRLKPSRHSTLAIKGPEEEPVFTLGVAARSNMQQLWRVEKPTGSLAHLDYQLKQVSSFGEKLPERSLFIGHAPAKIDARRIALERYFEAILDMSVDERAALIVCQYLSTQVIQVEDLEKAGSARSLDMHPNPKLGLDGRIIKEGFLTKRGKNFGGWKARFFVLDEPALRYYESPGGSFLGTIKILDAQIGRQSAQHSSHSPSRGGDDSNNQVRHAFLILEPKRKDSNNYIRHVLCAESDAERDEWVEALLQYVGGQSVNTERIRPPTVKNDSSSSKTSITQSRRKESGPEVLEPDMTDALRGVSYGDTIPGQAPFRNTDRHPLDPSSPTVSTQYQNYASNIPKIISGPTNGAIIQNAGAWGNKQPESPKTRERELRKRSIWGFREKISSDGITNHSNDSSSDLARSTEERLPNVRAVFGIPLQEAVDYCMAPGTDVYLPAVVYRCLEYLEAKGASNEEGIFRLSGSNVVIKALRERFNVEGDVDLLAQGQYYDVHAVASLLKLYLRELPSTVLTRELHLDFLQVLGTLPLALSWSCLC